MKLLISTSLLILVLIMVNKVTFAQSQPSNKTILDSLEVLKSVGGFVDGYVNPPTAEETRYHNITVMLFSLPFSETKKLLVDKNKFARAYGFSVSTKMHFDSLTKAHLEIFKDTSSFPLYTQRGIIETDIMLGEYCEMVYNSTLQEKETEAKQTDVIAAVKSFIRNNAKFSNSYEPLEFKGYTWSSSGNDITYEIKHLYNLNQNEGKSVRLQDYFILDKDFTIMLIEQTRSNIIKVDPPRIDEWVKVYGKN